MCTNVKPLVKAYLKKSVRNVKLQWQRKREKETKRRRFEPSDLTKGVSYTHPIRRRKKTYKTEKNKRRKNKKTKSTRRTKIRK